jgi:hypothetical protein
MTPPTAAFLAESPVQTRLPRRYSCAFWGVSLSEGDQKFLFRDTLGIDRLTKIGIRQPALMAPSWPMMRGPTTSILLGSAFLLLAEAGRLSLDARLWGSKHVEG